MTVQSTTATAREVLDDTRERLTPAAERLTEAAVALRDTLMESLRDNRVTLRDEVAPRVADKVAVVAPKVADKVADALVVAAGKMNTAADKVGARGVKGQRRRVPWRTVLFGAGAAAGALLVARMVMARRSAAQSWEYDPSKFGSERPQDQEITDPTEAKMHESVENAKSAVADAVSEASDKAAGTVADITERSRSNQR